MLPLSQYTAEMVRKVIKGFLSGDSKHQPLSLLLSLQTNPAFAHAK